MATPRAEPVPDEGSTWSFEAARQLERHTSQRVELVDGCIFPFDPPAAEHRRLMGRLRRSIGDALDARCSGNPPILVAATVKVHVRAFLEMGYRYVGLSAYIGAPASHPCSAELYANPAVVFVTEAPDAEPAPSARQRELLEQRSLKVLVRVRQGEPRVTLHHRVSGTWCVQTATRGVLRLPVLDVGLDVDELYRPD